MSDLCLDAVLEIVRAASRHRTRRALIEEMLASLRAAVPSDFAAVFLVRDGIHEECFTPMPLPMTSRRLSDYRSSTTLANGKSEVIHHADLAPYAIQREAWDAVDVRTACVMPMRVGVEPLGLIVCWSRDPDAYREIDLAAADHLAAAVAVAIDACLAHERVAEIRDRAAADNEILRSELRAQRCIAQLPGDSPAFRRVKEQIVQVGPTTATVLVLGESGSGKDLIAKALHESSPRFNKPMITVNCAALPATLAESELFGHEQGAFTGAAKKRKGRFELAQGGTLFLDEVGELPLELQAKLLRVLQERELERLGGSETIQLDVRIVAATNRNLRELVARRRFREDLYYRLAVFPIHVPSLRERRADLPALVEQLVEQAARRLRLPRRRVTADGLARLLAHEWRGNVRELQNVIERAMIVSQGETLDLDRIPLGTPPTRLPDVHEKAGDNDSVMRAAYEHALERAGWVIEGPSGAANALGIHPNTLRSRLKRLGLRRPT